MAPLQPLAVRRRDRARHLALSFGRSVTRTAWGRGTVFRDSPRNVESVVQTRVPVETPEEGSVLARGGSRCAPPRRRRTFPLRRGAPAGKPDLPFRSDIEGIQRPG